ncbi:MAG TPA: alpha/beta fold hydrolase [Actinomycetes bacterium]|jgi:pimeloyl-ACP methyl ester carboxylesterase|nr:alpha/beta fold hydrolase [Actinomycetes bacterium]
MNVTSFALALPDGRSLEVSVSGPDEGTPLVVHHGTPSARTQFPPFAKATAVRELRLVSYSRPGYGGSARQPGRAIADCAADTLAIIQQLGASRFYTAGWSGGGPHALACAALLPDRVLSCATIAGVGPFGAAGLDFLEGMGRENHEEFGAALAGPSELQAYLEREARAFAGLTGEQVAAALGDLVSPVDVTALTGDFAAYVAASFRQAVSNGIWGWFDDDLAFTRSWGFGLDDIRVPVVVWQGGQDRMVPFAHGRWLAAHVPGARPRLLAEEGHLSIAVASFGEIVDDLLASGPPVGR